MFSPATFAQLKEQLLKPDDSPNERKPQGRPGQRAVRGRADDGPASRQGRCWSGLSAISLGHRRRDELSASGAARACAMRGAPVQEGGWVDINTQHDVS